MNTFESYLQKTGEIGLVSEIVHFIAYIEGIPSARVNEILTFEDGTLGRVLSLGENFVEALLLSKPVKVGTRVARTGKFMEIRVDESILGKIISPLQIFQGTDGTISDGLKKIEVTPPSILERKVVDTPLETGVSLVDLAIPLGKGQRELVIGDRKTGKTSFLLQTIYNQVRLGSICVYVAIGKKRVDTKKFIDFFEAKKLLGSMVAVVTASSDFPGQIFLTPYVAMTIAEYFRDKGRDVLIVFDDLTTHAKYYREITLLAKRFPGRNSYPGDIFYIHSRLLERAGNFPKGAITAIPIAESILGDMSGYIQTNLMSMTDGHIFFDSEYASLGRRPAINPFLSVTRVGLQAQTPLVRDVTRSLSKFLVKIEKLRQFLHFGAELSEEIKRQLALGDRLTVFFDQPTDTPVPINMSVFLVALLWAGYWKEEAAWKVRAPMNNIIKKYLTDSAYHQKIDELIKNAKSLNELVGAIRDRNDLVTIT